MHARSEGVPLCSFPRGGEQNEKMGFYCVSLLLLSCLLHLSLSTPIAIPPTVLYGPPGQCAADTANATDDTLARLGSLLRERVIPTLNKRCSNEGYCEGNPAQSCRSIAIDNPEAASGEYWVRTCSGEAVRVYCDMTSRCCGGNGTSSEPGWMRVANLDMTDPSHPCPAGMFLDPDAPKRLCRRRVAEGCKSIFFPTYYLPYSKVCGRAVAYQDGTADAFWQYSLDNTLTLDNDFLDGMTITVGYPRTHVWSFAVSNTEGGEGADSVYACPCGRTDVPTEGVVPPFVENEYFCESGTENGWGQFGVLYPEDPLWDGEGCPENSNCCRLNNPPWFCKDLGRQFRNDFEVRLCGDEERGNEDIALEIIELYVQ